MKFLLVATIPLRSQCQNGDRQYNNNTLVIIEKLLLYFISHPPFILYYNKRRMRTVKFLDLCLRLWYQHSGLSHMMWREYPMQCSSSVKVIVFVIVSKGLLLCTVLCIDSIRQDTRDGRNLIGKECKTKGSSWPVLHFTGQGAVSRNPTLITDNLGLERTIAFCGLDKATVLLYYA